MDINNWKLKYYPVPASANMTDLEAMEHALLKFSGARKTILKRYKLVLDYSALFDKNGKSFSFDHESCALCHKYVDNQCYGCPIYNFEGKYCGAYGTAYREFCIEDNPQSMIKLLKQLIKECKSDII